MAFIIAVQLGLLALSLIASHYLAPDSEAEKVKAARLSDFGLPRASPGDAIALVYGTARLRSPALVWFGDLVPDPITIPGSGSFAEDQLVGYEYRLGMRFILCRGNERVGEAAPSSRAALRELLIGDKAVTLEGGAPFEAGGPPWNGYWKRLIDEDAAGGDWQGDLWFYSGGWDQTIASGFANGGDLGADPVEDPATTPGYRGQVMMSLRNWFVGQSATVQAISPIVWNPIVIPGYEDETAPINAHDVNPAAVLWDILTNPFGGIGSPTSTVDVASFAAAGEILRDEGHGISLAISRGGTARSVIEEILRQTDGVLYEDPETRQYVYALIREDYDVGDLPIFNETNVIGVPELSSSLWAEAVNEVRVIWTDPSRSYNDNVASAQDLAAVNAQGGRRKSVEYRFPGVTDAALAATLATRELNFLARPIMKLRITVDRTAINMRPGSVFRFQWTEWGLDAVFRVGELDGGTVTDGAITLNGVQDRFRIPGVLLPPPDVVDEPGILPTPISLRTITEAPRWIQQRAYDAGAIANVDAQHGYYLASPTGGDQQYRVDTNEATDAPARAFPGRFTVDGAYPRSAGPYDGGDLDIAGVVGWTPTAASGADIAASGANLIQIGGEILAFETVTDNGGGSWTLGNVWRGVLDTVPADHLDGVVGYILPGTAGAGALGRKILTHGDNYESVTIAGVGGAWTPASESPADTLTARSRVRLPYPVDSLLVLGSQTLAALKDDGVTLAYARRDRLELAITRPDAADEAPEAGTTYNAVAIKDGTTTTVLATGITSGSTVYPLGAAGHGVLEVGVDSALAVALPDGSTPTLGAWQVPTIEVDAPASRNLIVNGLFSNGTNNWTVTVGSASAGSGSGSLGGGGTMVTPAGSVATLTLHQDVPIQGYPPADLRAWLEFAAGPTTGDANDTIAAVLTSRDAGGSVLQTQTLAAVHPTAWDRYSLEIANLDPDTATIRVQLLMATAASGVGVATHADIGVTEVRLHVGDFTGQLLTGNEFASLAGWTAPVGTWQILTAAPLYACAQYVRPNDHAAATLYRDFTPAAGYERNATVVARFGRANDGADDTGTVTLYALDGGGANIGSATTGAEALAVGVWQRRYLALVLPEGTATIRVQLEAARVTGTPNNACFADFDCRIHKALDPIVDIDHRLLSPPTQRIPRDRHEWFAAFPSVACPNVAMLDGEEVGRLGVEPVVETVGAAYTGGSFICDEGRRDGRLRSPCYDLAGGSARVAAFGQFMNFSSTEFWCVGVAYKSDAWQGGEVGLVARQDGARGWELFLDAGGTATALVYGAGGNAAVSGDALSDPGQGVMRMAFLHHDPGGAISIIDQGGVSTAGSGVAGQFRGTTPTRATIGASPSGGVFTGQIARVWAWRGGSTPTTAEIASLFTYADNAAGITDPYPRAGAIATICGSDADGPLLRGWPVGVAPYATREELSGTALISVPEVTNRAVTDFLAWSTVGSAVVATVVDPFAGMRSARSIESAGGDGIRSPAMALGTAATLYAKVCYVAPDGAATVVLEDNSGATVASQSLAQTAVPLVAEFTMAWSGATSGVGRLRITSANAARTLTVSPVHYLGTANPGPGVFPFGAAGAACPSITIAPTTLYNAEGELTIEADLNNVADGIVARAWNASNSNDERRIELVGGSVSSSHGTGTGSLDTATVSGGYDTAALLTARLRWARTGLRDGVASEFSVARVEQGGSAYLESGRAATWTPSATEVTRLDLGHDDGADAVPMAFGRVRVRAREPRL